MASGGIDPWRHKCWLSGKFLKVCLQKNIESAILFVNYTKAFDSIRGERRSKFYTLAYCLPKETVAAILMLCKNAKVKVGSPYRNTDYFDIVAGVLQGDTLAPYFFIICLDYLLRTSIEKKNERKRFQANKGKKQEVLC